MKNLLEEAKKFSSWKSPWNTANKVLYDLCKKHPSHKDNEAIMAKTWLIGRSYAASLERRKNKTAKENNENFYQKTVTKAFKKSKLDNNLKKIRDEKDIKQILQTHHELVQTIKKITNNKKRSFASKYLHFHKPKYYYIYDSIAAKRISKIIKENTKIKEIEKELKKQHTTTKAEKEYKKFYLRCEAINKHLKQKKQKTLTKRQLDNLLLYWETK